MDYNDIQKRLQKLYSSIGEQYLYHDDALDTFHSEQSDEGWVMFSFFNPKDEPKLLNQINNIIANLANIKDCLKRILRNSRQDENVIENEINNSTHLQLILDLANQEKHGYPLEKIRRSKKDPLIKNVGRLLTPSNKPDNITIRRSDGSAIKNMMAITTADITDGQGNLLCRLDFLIENALNDWDIIIKKYNIA